MHLILGQTISSAEAQVGQTIEFEVVDDIVIDGVWKTRIHMEDYPENVRAKLSQMIQRQMQGTRRSAQKFVVGQVLAGFQQRQQSRMRGTTIR